MKFRIDLTVDSKKEWVDAVLNDFNAFLQDHADCERKASGMALSLVAKYPNRTEIIPELIDTSVEELEHFRDVYAIMQRRGLQLNHEIPKDLYIQQLLKICRDGREERFMDRLLLASLVETRGAERFRLVYEALEDEELKQFYHRLWASEARHGEVFVRMALNYFEEDDVYNRLEEMKEKEGVILNNLEIRPALH
ncbi:tRNA-(ms[2]io[6]A)-hydroxylase [Ekhidna lutea]|uniref:tRNA-(Ms[2]io[6]A)-hydroxylase n=1 Tax=Ekhidna lutea TaxID=447679 RepID=A0A239LDW7_EKHLU|nr:tRNA-(ms[2]io[6]A)-hydroxylase [Ekhidna lutea]SNT28515.1 tRNA-(ms[2]io[6]A)-hydroxylase [Ekhidna lutea]